MWKLTQCNSTTNTSALWNYAWSPNFVKPSISSVFPARLYNLYSSPKAYLIAFIKVSHVNCHFLCWEKGLVSMMRNIFRYLICENTSLEQIMYGCGWRFVPQRTSGEDDICVIWETLRDLQSNAVCAHQTESKRLSCPWRFLVLSWANGRRWMQRPSSGFSWTLVTRLFHLLEKWRSTRSGASPLHLITAWGLFLAV